MLTLRPTVIVCDEAVAAQDASIQADILDPFAGLQRAFGPTCICITHHRGVVAHVSDRVAVMYLGRLADGRLRGAALDVFEPEPLPDDHPFRRVSNLFLTPHVAGLTEDSVRRMSVQAAEEAIRVLHGERPASLVNPEAWDAHLRRLQGSP